MVSPKIDDYRRFNYRQKIKSNKWFLIYVAKLKLVAACVVIELELIICAFTVCCVTKMVRITLDQGSSGISCDNSTYLQGDQTVCGTIKSHTHTHEFSVSAYRFILLSICGSPIYWWWVSSGQGQSIGKRCFVSTLLQLQIYFELLSGASSENRKKAIKPQGNNNKRFKYISIPTKHIFGYLMHSHPQKANINRCV